MQLEIRAADLSGMATLELIATHVSAMHDDSPADSCHALDIDGLLHPLITVWTAWFGDDIAGMGALKDLDAHRGEIKAMRVPDRFRSRGVGRALVAHIVDAARARGMTRLLLETGSSAEFTPARRLYLREGFVYCEPFDGYDRDRHSVFMTREIPRAEQARSAPPRTPPRPHRGP